MIIYKSKEYINFLRSNDKNIVKKLNDDIYNRRGIKNTVFYSLYFGPFKVLDKFKNINNMNYYKIKFLESGYKTISAKSNIMRGTVKDYLAKSVFGVGSYGSEYINIKNDYPLLSKILVVRWTKMLGRVYNKNDINYVRYGGAGVKVANEWLVFSNFFYDVKEILDKNNLTERFINGELHMDKDILQKNIPTKKRIYSKSTVSFVTKSENDLYRDIKSIAFKNSSYFISIKNGKEIIEKNIRKFGREHNIDSRRICEILNGKIINSIKYDFRYPTDKELDLINKGILKIGDVIKG